MNRIDLTNVVYFTKPKPLKPKEVTNYEKLYSRYKYLNTYMNYDDVLEIKEWLFDNKRNNFERANRFLFLDAIEKLGDRFESKYLMLDLSERKDFLFLLCQKYNIA